MKYSKRIWIHVILNKNSDHLKMWELKLHLNKRIWNFSLTSAHDYSLKNLVLSLSRLNPFSCVTLILPSSLVLSYSICSLCGGLFSLTVARSRSWCLKFIFLFKFLTCFTCHVDTQYRVPLLCHFEFHSILLHGKLL